PPGPGEHDDADPVVPLRLLHRHPVLEAHPAGPGVAPVRPVQGDEPDAVRGLEADRLPFHVRTIPRPASPAPAPGRAARRCAPPPPAWAASTADPVRECRRSGGSGPGTGGSGPGRPPDA